MSISTEPAADVPSSPLSRERVLTNSTVSMLGFAIYTPVALLVSRAIVHAIGIRSFGLWAALTTVVALGGPLDLGMAAPVTKYVAEYRALGRDADINRLLSTAMVLYAAAAVTASGVLLFSARWVVVHVLHGGAHAGAALTLYDVIVAGSALSLIASVLPSLLAGLQRVDVSAGVSLAVNLVGAVATMVVLRFGLGLNGLALVWMGGILLSIVTNLLIARRLLPSLHLNPLLCDVAMIRRILRLSTRVQITNVTLFLNDQLDRTLIAYALGPFFLGYFQLAQRAAATIPYGCTALTQGLLPAAADLAARDQWDRLRTLQLRASRYLAVSTFGPCAGIGGLAFPLVRAWLGPGYERVSLTIVILLAGYLCWLPCQAITPLLNGIGRPDIRMRADLAFLALHLPLCAFLLWRVGYFGGITGTAFALATTRLPIYVAGSRALGTGVRDLVRGSLWGPLVSAAAGLAVVVAAQLLIRASGGLVLAAESGTFVAVYSTLTWRLSFDGYDRQLVLGRLTASWFRLRPSLRSIKAVLSR
jgi:O-antigen/teichoic acid export membrane protein